LSIALEIKFGQKAQRIRKEEENHCANNAICGQNLLKEMFSVEVFEMNPSYAQCILLVLSTLNRPKDIYTFRTRHRHLVPAKLKKLLD